MLKILFVLAICGVVNVNAQPGGGNAQPGGGNVGSQASQQELAPCTNTDGTVSVGPCLCTHPIKKQGRAPWEKNCEQGEFCDVSTIQLCSKYKVCTCYQILHDQTSTSVANLGETFRASRTLCQSNVEVKQCQDPSFGDNYGCDFGDRTVNDQGWELCSSWVKQCTCGDDVENTGEFVSDDVKNEYSPDNEFWCYYAGPYFVGVWADGGMNCKDPNVDDEGQILTCRVADSFYCATIDYLDTDSPTPGPTSPPRVRPTPRPTDVQALQTPGEIHIGLPVIVTMRDFVLTIDGKYPVTSHYKGLTWDNMARAVPGQNYDELNQLINDFLANYSEISRDGYVATEDVPKFKEYLRTLNVGNDENLEAALDDAMNQQNVPQIQQDEITEALDAVQDEGQRDAKRNLIAALDANTPHSE